MTNNNEIIQDTKTEEQFCLFLYLVSDLSLFIRYGSFGVLAAVGLLTVILVFIPREPQSPEEDEDAFKVSWVPQLILHCSQANMPFPLGKPEL